MMYSYMRAIGLCASVFLASGCASQAVLAPPDLPASLRAPAGQSVYLEARATGVQIYECAARPDPTSGFEWVFRAPDAVLFDRSGRAIGKHYGGPTWESSDGSTVVGEVRARDPGPDPAAIPWLLLGSKATTRAGTFSQAKSIQRVQTVGGIPPSGPCGADNVKQVARVPYMASYFFYRD